MKKDDGGGDMFLLQICDIYFIRGDGDDDDRVSFTDPWTELHLWNNMMVMVIWGHGSVM